MRSLFEEARERVPAIEAARFYGVDFDRKNWALCHGVDALLDCLRQFRDLAKNSGEMLSRPEDRTKTTCLSQMLMDDGREYHGDQFNIIEGLLRATDDEFIPWIGDVAAILM